MSASLFKSDASDGEFPKINWACNMVDVETLTAEVRDTPKGCKPWEAIVCPKRTGICGSDMHFYLGHQLDPTKGLKRSILGHESSGIVAEVGDQVKDLKVGDRVALEPGEPCYRCIECKSGQYAQCEYMQFAAAVGSTYGKDGTLQAYYQLPADLCHKIPDNLSLEEGAMMEPLVVAVNSVTEIARQRPAANVAVFGAGPVGLLTMAVAKAMGARRIIAIDINQARLDFAKQYAATDIHLAEPQLPDETREEYSRRHGKIISEKFDLSERGPRGIDVVYECSGAETCVQTGFWILKRRGQFIQIGNGQLYSSIPLQIVAFREIVLKGVFRYGAGIYWMAIDLVSRGLVDLKPLVTHRYSFEDAKQAFVTTRNGKSEDGKIAIKVIIDGPRVD